MTFILAELRSMGCAENRAGMARYGINVDHAFGVSVYELRKIAKRIGRDHHPALALWATGNHEARLLACFVDDPACVTADQMEAWAGDDPPPVDPRSRAPKANHAAFPSSGVMGGDSGG